MNPAKQRSLGIGLPTSEDYLSASCPECGHRTIDHSEAQYWPEGTCNHCRREMNPFNSGNPRAAEDVCKLTSIEVRLRNEGGES